MPVLLVRHAKAGSRAEWSGEDRTRPLSAQGRDQARRLAAELAPLAPRRLLSSPFARCTETVAPLAHRLGLPVEVTEDLAEGQAQAALHLLRSLAGQTVVAVSHGDVIPEVLLALADRDRVPVPASVQWPKASTWVLDGTDGRFTSVEYRPPPAPGAGSDQAGGR